MEDHMQVKLSRVEPVADRRALRAMAYGQITKVVLSGRAAP
jgi:hypothetical protein